MRCVQSGSRYKPLALSTFMDIMLSGLVTDS